MDSRLSNIDLLNRVDSYPHRGQDLSYLDQQDGGPIFTLIGEDRDGPVPLGYVRRSLVNVLGEMPVSERGDMTVDAANCTVSLALLRAASEPDRTKGAAALVHNLRARNMFRSLADPSGEMLPVFGRDGSVLFSIDRSALFLFGFVGYGVHMLCYVKTPHGISIWVARRAANKSSYPDMLDTTVGGSLSTGEQPIDGLVREADEEATLAPEFVRQRARPAGLISYIIVGRGLDNKADGRICPEVMWMYDMDLTDGPVPQPNDDEVANFTLMSSDRVKDEMARGSFKHNSAVICLKFLMQHGLITPADEPSFDEIQRRFVREIPFPTPKF